jgi:hypothetical protein
LEQIKGFAVDSAPSLSRERARVKGIGEREHNVKILLALVLDQG